MRDNTFLVWHLQWCSCEKPCLFGLLYSVLQETRVSDVKNLPCAASHLQAVRTSIPFLQPNILCPKYKKNENKNDRQQGFKIQMSYWIANIWKGIQAYLTPNQFQVNEYKNSRRVENNNKKLKENKERCKCFFDVSRREVGEVRQVTNTSRS